ncbi:mediator complex subunit MED31 [Toxoplasma gondii TgCatPRC2]|uniref:Mediator of RNA polymerase II transcription subunit 31 n=6 Tax=Toxoplasma gondii TaxID=5811 RepID=S7UWU5_TOXGG|nr:mediator complex subunit MED31 [Toxoplasma gondii GT1]KAF4640637.1 mediator complex subunit MED31 [Toxoplasma gondii]KFG55147.1 mediator complex subunit MED31 [Toxoplasma gondii FOU]KYK71953.1 mediator complex subunit MED31 [Toxoplasma gondii TgCatPRC2]PUA91197.1 mediator complex subunit MED31 [Toxoplasma gondii TgCATBr9]RQX74554.1 mediator complex subunit MED31 [Toxoplasma gondii CAST]
MSLSAGSGADSPQEGAEKKLEERAAHPESEATNSGEQPTPAAQKATGKEAENEKEAERGQEREGRERSEQHLGFSGTCVVPVPPHLSLWEENAAMNLLRFEAECEFVQALANPYYLRHLQKERYFQDPRFVAYLHYLDYWRHPPYVQHLLFPVCLGVLDLVQKEEIRDRLEREDVVAVLDQTLRLHWLYFACDKNKI